MVRISYGIAIGIVAGFAFGLGLAASMLMTSGDSVADIGD